jgi:hypothetical protein
LDLKEPGTNQVFCYVAPDGGLNVQYYENAVWGGEPVRKSIAPGVNIEQGMLQTIDFINSQQFSARWDGLLRPPVTANYTISLEAAFTRKAMLLLDSRHYVACRCV